MPFLAIGYVAPAIGTSGTVVHAKPPACIRRATGERPCASLKCGMLTKSIDGVERGQVAPAATPSPCVLLSVREQFVVLLLAEEPQMGVQRILTNRNAVDDFIRAFAVPLVVVIEIRIRLVLE